ncbi:MAG: hypothetical protein AB7J13_13780 [Pyrinomonadaceae bacterium]
MERYRYRKLRVMCYEARWYGIDQLRSAVEYLRTVEQTPHVGLVAYAAVVPAGPFLLEPKPMLGLSKILGKTPAEVWEAFDADVDEQISGLLRRGVGVRP